MDNGTKQKLKAGSPAKLRDGGWGARVYGDVQEGDVAKIETKSGKSWEARVTKVLARFTNDDGSKVALCETQGMDRGGGR